MTSVWAGGRYAAVGDRIAGIGVQIVSTAETRIGPGGLHGLPVVDLACGTGSVALTAAGRGAQVTGVDLTGELIDIAARAPGGDAVSWLVGDAGDTGLPSQGYQAALSNMGIVFVEPDRQVAELERLLRPGAVLGFSSWVRGTDNPLYDPITEVLGPPPVAGFSADQWGEAEVVTERLHNGFDDVRIDSGTFTWEFGSHAEAMAFVEHQSPLHVEVFRRAGQAGRAEELRSAFAAALPDTDRPAFGVPYVVVTAVRRDHRA